MSCDKTGRKNIRRHKVSEGDQSPAAEDSFKAYEEVFSFLKDGAAGTVSPLPSFRRTPAAAPAVVPPNPARSLVNAPVGIMEDHRW